MKVLSKILAATTALGMATGAYAADMTMKFGHVGKPGSLFEASVDHFAAWVNGAMGGKVEVQTFGSSQLGKDKELLQKLKLGQVEFALPSSVMSSVDDTFGVFEMPYIIQSRDHMLAVEEAIFEDTFQAKAKEHGYRILALWENGFRHITNNERPINTPADLAGLKIRTPNSSWRVAMFDEYGANPTPMSFSEVFVSLQTGVIDGQENPLTNIAGAKLQEVQKYLSLSNHVYSPAYPTVGVAVFEKLDPEVQAILVETAQEMAIWAREQGAAAEGTLLDELKADGMEVNTADRAAFVAASKPLYEKFASEVEGGQKMIDDVLNLAGGGS